MTKEKPKFLRRTWSRYSKLGKRKKKKQVWRSPKGRDNKMREKRKGYPAVVSVGYKQDKKLRGTIEKKHPVIIQNIKDLNSAKENQIIILGNIGKKKKIEIVRKSKEKKIKIHNLNIEKFLKKIEKEAKTKVKKIENKKGKIKKKEIKK